jgi:glycine cleavage system aminomethyltransferase T
LVARVGARGAPGYQLRLAARARRKVAEELWQAIADDGAA